MKSLLQHVERLPRTQVILFALVLVLFVGTIDYLTGSEIAFSVFYLIPITLSVWFLSVRAGVAFSLLSALIWFAAELGWHAEYHIYSPVLLWNTSIRLGIFLIVNQLVGTLKDYQRHRAAYEARLQIDEAVRKNEERYRGLVESMSEGYLVTDPRGIITFCSPNIGAHFDTPGRALVGVQALSFIDGEERRRVTATYRRAIRAGLVHLLTEFRVHDTRGVVLWIEQSSRMVRDAQGSLVECRSIIRDVTARKRVDNQVRLLAQALESSAELISITDLESRFVFINRSFREQYGYSEGEILGKSPIMLQPVRIGAELSKEIFLQTRMGGWTGELINVKKSGEEFPIQLSTSRIEDDRGTVLGLIGVARDISDQKRAEAALHSAQVRFENLFTEQPEGTDDTVTGVLEATKEPIDARLHDLASRINDVTERMRLQFRRAISLSTLASHELRTPLMVIRHQLEDVLNVNASMEDTRKTLVSVYDDTLRLSRTIEQFLRIGTLQSGTIKLSFVEVDVHGLLQKFYDEALFLSRSREISVVLGQVPKVHIRGDADQLRQLLFNLLDNSLKNTPKGGYVRIIAEQADGAIQLRFSDSGRGIPPEILPRVFDPFFKSGTDALSTRGAGLGLAHVKWIVEAHEGTISVESETGKGTTFFLRFPTVVPVHEPTAAAPAT